MRQKWERWNVLFLSFFIDFAMADVAKIGKVKCGIFHTFYWLRNGWWSKKWERGNVIFFKTFYWLRYGWWGKNGKGKMWYFSYFLLTSLWLMRWKWERRNVIFFLLFIDFAMADEAKMGKAKCDIFLTFYWLRYGRWGKNGKDEMWYFLTFYWHRYGWWGSVRDWGHLTWLPDGWRVPARSSRPQTQYHW